MAISEHKAALLENYRNRDIDAIIRTTKGLMQDPEFPS